MTLIFEIPVTIGAIGLSRIILFDPLFKTAIPYFKTNDDGYTKYFKFFTAVTLYYLLFNNLLFLPIYFLQIFIGTIIVFTILCILTPLWEILMTSFKFTDIFTSVKKSKYSYHNITPIIEYFNTSIIGDLIINSKKRRNNNERKNQFLQLGIDLSKKNNFSSILKKNNLFNQNVQQKNVRQNFRYNSIIIMNANVLVKLTKLLSVTPHQRSKSSKFLSTYVNDEKSLIPRHRRNSLLICDSKVQNKSNEKVKEIYVAPPGDLFLLEKINELDKELVDLTDEYEDMKEQNVEINEKIQDLINQKQQYQVQAQENIISKDVTKLSIPAFTIKQENSKNFAVYVIMVQRLDASTGQVKAGWIIPRRYNDFFSLNQHLKNQFVDKFEFPGKTLFNILNNHFLESRRIQLENYLQSLLTKDEVCEDRKFLKFLSK